MAINPIIFTNVGKLTAKATPVDGGEAIALYCTQQSVPGFPDSPTWGFVDNNPAMQVGLKEVGKSEGMNPLEFRVVYTPSLLAVMVNHQANGTKFEIEYVYDDKTYNELLNMTVHDCFILNPGSSETTEINGVAYMDVKFQPRGGGMLADIVTITAIARS